VTAAIRTDALTRDFGPVRALEELTLEVPPGTIFGFLGPNGAGKTTTIRLLLGLLEPTAGSAEVLGFDVATRSGEVRERVGVLLEGDGLYTRLTALQNLDFFGRVAHLTAADRYPRIQALLEATGLWQRRNDRVNEFSRGMRQKLALARAFLARPSLLFLDEPTSGLDTPSAVALRNELVALAREEGVTVFLTTHNLLEAEKVCDRVAVIRSGKLLAEGVPHEIAAAGEGRRMQIVGSGFTEQVVLGVETLAGVRSTSLRDGRLAVELETSAPTAPIVRFLVESGAEVAEASLARESLEETFLALLEEETELTEGSGANPDTTAPGPAVKGIR
jgi:ABC-2 type transport system ATP-binding protein